jgi:hypothetical protein
MDWLTFSLAIGLLRHHWRERDDCARGIQERRRSGLKQVKNGDGFNFLRRFGLPLKQRS